MQFFIVSKHLFLKNILVKSAKCQFKHQKYLIAKALATTLLIVICIFSYHLHHNKWKVGEAYAVSWNLMS